MFYSTEILSDKRSALSTVWRAGNTAPGARSTGIRRKAILEVNVQRACGTIKDPPGAPIALRLQGTLLYGTARIYQEQCRFVLTDSERIQQALIKLCSNVLDNKLDRDAGKTKSVHIALPNDPSFDLDFLQLPPFDFDAQEDASFISQTARASWTSLSIKSQSSNNTQLPQLILDADSSGRQSYAGGFQYSGSGSPSVFERQLGIAEDDNLLVDVGLFIDENGNIIEEEPRSEPQLPAFSAFPVHASKSGQYTAHGTVEEKFLPMIIDDDEQHIQSGNIAPTAAKTTDNLPLGTGSRNAAPNARESSETSSISSPRTVSSTAMALKQARQRPPQKCNFVDEVTQIPLSDYFSFVTNYAQNMERTLEKRDRVRAIRRANDTARSKEAAYSFTFGRGVFGVADELKCYHGYPLVQMFAGESLEEALYGDALSEAKRRRVTTTVEPSTPIGRAGRGAFGGFDDEQDIEVGRQPASALSDNPSLPLNRPSSAIPGSSVHGSVQRSAGPSRQQPGTLSSAGRHSSPNFIERYSDDDLELPAQLPSNSVDPFSRPGTLPVAVPAESNACHGSSNSKLGEEIRNASVFLSLVCEKATAEGVARPGYAAHRWVEFGSIVAPFKSDRSAVVTAFMNLLTLATSRKLCIAQIEEEDMIDRDIFVGVNLTKRDKGKGKRSFQEMSEDNSDSASSHNALTSGDAFPEAMVVDNAYHNDTETAGPSLVGAA